MGASTSSCRAHRRKTSGGDRRIGARNVGSSEPSAPRSHGECVEIYADRQSHLHGRRQPEDGAQSEMVAALSRRSATRLSRSEEHTSELQSLMRISYAVFCLKKKK